MEGKWDALTGDMFLICFYSRCFGTSLIPRTTTEASLQQQRKPLQKTLPNFAQVDSKEGNLNGTDVVPLPVAVPARLGWFFFFWVVLRR